MEPLLTIDDVADYLQLSPRSLYRLIEKNQLPFAIKIGGSWRFKKQDVLNWVDKCSDG